MPAGGLDFFAHGALPAPRVSVAETERVTGEPLGVLKLANRAISLNEVEAQVL
ncbi:MAG: hypothetical protein M0T77_09775 [Actinomycetota bacterium]|nr:hypothetical protein [Actinomycetota bacterium]